MNYSESGRSPLCIVPKILFSLAACIFAIKIVFCICSYKTVGTVEIYEGERRWYEFESKSGKIAKKRAVYYNADTFQSGDKIKLRVSFLTSRWSNQNSFMGIFGWPICFFISAVLLKIILIRNNKYQRQMKEGK